VFVQRLLHLRMTEPVLRRRKYFQGRSIRGGKDVAWLAPDGREMTDEAWGADFVRSLGMLLSGTGIEEVDEIGEAVVGNTLLVLLSAHDEQVPFTLPPLEADHHWQRIFDTIEPQTEECAFKAGDRYPLQGRSVAVLKVAPPVFDRRRGTSATSLAAPPPGDARTPPETPQPAATAPES
jgi:glycogen operon protein